MADDCLSFTFQHVKPKEGSAPLYIILMPKHVPNVEGIDTKTGAEHGFFWPTNPNNAEGATRSNFCTGFDRIDWPVFGPKKPPPLPGASSPPPPPQPNKKGHPSPAAYKAIGELKYARPKDFFDLQISPGYITNICKGTNFSASAVGVGIGVTGTERREFGNFVQFDDAEFYKFIGIHFANGLNPRPSFESWFTSMPHRPLYLYSANFVNGGVFDHTVHGVKVSGLRRWRHFCRFLTSSNYRWNPVEEQRKDLMWKVQSLLDELNHRARKHWIPGKWVAINEQTIGFKGRSGMTLCISYKREGDGFQCDALCDKNYTFSFFFQHGDTPKLGKLGCSFLQESEEFLKYSFLIFLEIFGNARTFLRTYNFGTGTKNECGRTWVWRSCGVCA